jgi:hypothetical protein
MRRRIRKIGLIIGAVVLLFVAALGGLYFAFMENFKAEPPNADYPKPTSALEAQRQDLDYSLKVMAFDRSFSASARAQAKRRVAGLEQLPQALPRQKLQVALMQIMALADNGHTRTRTGIEGKTVMMAPVRVARFADGFFVMRAKAPWRDLLGGRIESIDGMPFPQILNRLEMLRGGTEAFRRENAAVSIAVQDVLYGLGIARDARQSVWTVRLPDRKLATRTLVAEPDKADIFVPDGLRWRSPEPLKSMGKGWVSATPKRMALPLSEENMDALHFRARVPGSCAMYVRLEAIESRKGWDLQRFLADTEAEMRSRPPCAVIFDLRDNGGGDYTNMWHFTHALPKLIRPGGHIYLLTDPGTFSAAITTAAFTKDAGDGKVTIMGEPVGDRLSFYAEGGRATLPNSRLAISFQTGKHDYAHPCRDWRNCYWVNWFYPVRVKTLQPDIYVPARFGDWHAGHDPAFEDAVALANNAEAYRSQPPA